MTPFSRSDLRSIFATRFALATWKQLLSQLDAKLYQTPRAVKIAQDEPDVKGFLLGELETSDYTRIGLFRFTVKPRDIERRRVGLRRFVQDWIKTDYDAALVIFDSNDPDSTLWRCSFVSNLRDAKTTPKRYSFIFGQPDGQYRTASERFETLLKTANGSAPQLGAFLEAFGVESLTKAFYGELFDWYQWALSPEVNVTFPNIVSDDSDNRQGLEVRLIRLITRLMFVWFIRQKKLIPDCLFDSQYLSEQLLQEGFEPYSLEQVNYYNAVLQNLFFATLNNEIDRRKFAQDPSVCYHNLTEDYGIKTLFRNPKGGSYFRISNEEVLNLFAPIPFLNGGLFECLDKPRGDDSARRLISNDGFSRAEGRAHRAYIPNAIFFGLERGEDAVMTTFTHPGEPTPRKQGVLGIFQILSRYNFTIEENTPDDVDVALDPELLGKVFENLLGTFNPETCQTARKESGAFYTPREIVDYMSDAAIDTYLAPVKDAAPEVQINHLKAIRILDPACGSGAFPMGMLNALVRRLEALGSTESPYALKLHLIENCLFGVDIQPIAVQITRLRFYISLVCDITPDPTDRAHNYNVPYLPNLDTRFIAADTLRSSGIKALEQGNLFEGNLLELRDQLFRVREEHFTAKNNQVKHRCRRDDADIRRDISELLCRENCASNETAEALARWNPYDQDATAPYFDPTWMFNQDTFHIVIGNPPYIQLQDNNGLLGARYKDCGYQSFERTGDIYCLFYERGINLLAPNGALCYITSNKWMRAGYGQSLRRLLAQNNPITLIDFAGVPIFESATVDTNILLIQRAENAQATQALTAKPACRGNLAAYVQANAISCDFDTADHWVILAPLERAIKQKIEAVGKPLKDWDISINYGVKTGCNEAFILTAEQRDAILATCATATERTRTAQLLRPVLRGRDIKRYRTDYANLYLIGTHNGYGDVPPVCIDDYPALKQWLDVGGTAYNGKPYKGYKVIAKRADKGITPYNLRHCAYWQDFDKPKIVYPNMTKFLPFYFDETEQFVTNQKCFIITGKPSELAYLTAFLGSSLFKFAFRNTFPELQGGTRELSKIFMEKVSVKPVTAEEGARFEQLVREIQQEYTLERAKAIDQAIFDHYELSEADRQTIGFIEIQ